MAKKNLLNPCSTAIQKTLAYSSVFKYPLTFYQLSTYLISNKKFKYKEFRKQLKRLVSKGFVKQRKGKYYLPGVKNIDSEKRKKYSKRLIRKNRKILKCLESVPWIKMICITGSTANYSADHKTDLDLMFVTSKNRVWLTRGFVFLILRIVGKLPPSDFNNREICPNIFMDEKNLSWKKHQRNLYVAKNIIAMQPIYNKENMYFRFLRANAWLHKYVAQFNFYSPIKFKKLRSSKSTILNSLEKLSYKMQLKYMEKKRTHEVVSKRLIHFNKNDNSQKTLTAYKNVLGNRKIG